MTIKEAALALEMSESAVYRMLNDGRLTKVELPQRKLRGGRVRVLAESVEQYLPPERRQPRPAAPPREP